jgi:hypothetical protein
MKVNFKGTVCTVMNENFKPLIRRICICIEKGIKCVRIQQLRTKRIHADIADPDLNPYPALHMVNCLSARYTHYF